MTPVYTIKSLIDEIDMAFNNFVYSDISEIIKIIKSSNRIVTCGAGRVGLSARCFSMRLNHLGFHAYHLGDANVPHLNSSDLLIIGSGSGQTQTIYDIAKIANENNIPILLFSSTKTSRIANLSTKIIIINTPNKNKTTQFKSIQPMTTLFEQCIFLLFDLIVLEIMKENQETSESMWKRHSILE